MTGRGAWPNSGAGGTLTYPDGDAPGPYYTLPSGDLPKVGSAGWESEDVNERAVHGAVLAIQRALRRRGYDVAATGTYNQATFEAVTAFQQSMGLTVWGGVGETTAQILVLPDLHAACEREGWTRWRIVGGLTQTESNFDLGCVGEIDPEDIGLAQINGPNNPDLTEVERLRPVVAFGYIAAKMKTNLATFDGNLRDAIAAYNLGVTGAFKWIADGRPDLWTPPGQSRERDVKGYIDKITNWIPYTS
jgi:peptidoglycan hydrolase-like protein with peptidoglycan-binding domain